MLKFLRKKNVAKKIFLVLAIIIIPAFVFWGVGTDIGTKDESKYIGKIFNKKVTIDEFKKAYRTVFIQASLRFGDEFKKIEPFLNLSEQAWDRLILLREVKNKHTTIKNKEVINFIQEFSLFQKNGKFDDKMYNQILSYLRIEPREFEEQIRDTIKIEKLFHLITKTITLDDKEALEIYKEKNDKIKIDYLTFLIKDYKQQVKFDKNQLKEFYDKNSASFPLKFNKVKDEVEEAFIDEKGKELAKNQALSSLNNLKKASIKDEAGFLKACKTINLTPHTPKEFTKEDYVDNVGINKHFTDTAFNQPIGQVSEVIETPSGFFIIFTKDYIFADEEIFEAQKEKLKEQYLTEKKQKTFNEFFKNIKKRTQLYTLPK